MTDAPDADLGADGWERLDEIPPGIEMNQVGRVTAAASSIEFGLFMCLWKLVSIPDVRMAFALFGNQQFEQSSRTLRAVLARLREDGEQETFGSEWDEALKAAKKAMDKRNVLLHSTWIQGGFTPWKELGRTDDPQTLTWQWMMQLANELEGASVRISELLRTARP